MFIVMLIKTNYKTFKIIVSLSLNILEIAMFMNIVSKSSSWTSETQYYDVETVKMNATKL